MKKIKIFNIQIDDKKLLNREYDVYIDEKNDTTFFNLEFNSLILDNPNLKLYEVFKKISFSYLVKDKILVSVKLNISKTYFISSVLYFECNEILPSDDLVEIEYDALDFKIDCEKNEIIYNGENY